MSVENNTYYGTFMGEDARNEIRIWIDLLQVLCKGMPRPHDITYVISKIEQLERTRGIDLSDVKGCCSPDGTVWEAKDFKPYITNILERIFLIGEISNPLKESNYE